MMQRKCSDCKILKPLGEFNKKGKRNGKQRFSHYCRECSNKRNRGYYVTNKAKQITAISKNKSKYIQRNREFVYNFLLDHPCVDCNEKNPIKLEFDHQTSKVDEISRCVNTPYSLDKLKREISKCLVRCASCHRMKTAKDQSWWAYNQYQMTQKDTKVPDSTLNSSRPTQDELEQWLHREYPDGVIDFQQEHERLLGVVEQFLTSPTSNAAKSVLLTAIECGHFLQSRHEESSEV